MVSLLRKQILLILSVSTFGVSHASYFIDGNELVAAMREYDKAVTSDSDTEYYEVGIYTGFVYGVYDVYGSSNSICPSENVTRGQVGSVVSKFLKEFPERWDEPAFQLVVDALKKAFPCT